MRNRIAFAVVSSLLLVAAGCSSSNGNGGSGDDGGGDGEADGTTSGSSSGSSSGGSSGAASSSGTTSSSGSSGASGSSGSSSGSSSGANDAGTDADATVTSNDGGSSDATVDANDGSTTTDAHPGDSSAGGNPYYDGNPGNCGAWTSISATKIQANVGETIWLNAAATGANVANLGYTWAQATGDGGTVGVFGQASDEAAGATDVMTFMCTSPGTATITLTVDEGPDAGSCDSLLTKGTTTITCNAQPQNEILSAWVELASTGASNADGGSATGNTYSIARVITAATSCPTITLNGGSAVTMNTRAVAATNPLRPTTSAASMSKPSAFPVLTCEYDMPSGTTSAVVNAALPGGSASTTLPLPKADAETIVVLGDTGCRTQYGAGGTSQWQSCYDSTQYAFATIASVAAGLHPDLVIHAGDYEYRDNECPPDQAGCAGAPWGYGWDAWQDDFFKPAAPLLAAAPWVVARGNHESCTRAGQGWYRFLDVNGYDTVAGKDCNTQGATIAADAGGGFAGDNLGGYNTPYAVQVRGDTQVIVFDTSNITKSAITATGANGNEYAAYATEVQQVAGLTRSSMFNIWTNHHPLFGLAAGPPVASSAPALLSVMQNLYPDTIFPPGINMALHGHVHLFEAIDYTATASDAGVPNNYPATFVSGNAGDILDTDLPDPLPDGSTPLPTAAVPPSIANIAHSPNFGFLVMQHQAGDGGGNGTWLLTEYKTDGTTVRTKCTASMDGHTSCTVWGFIQ